MKVQVLDESDNGLAIGVLDREPFEIGFQFRIGHGTNRRTAAVKQVTEMPTGWRVGFEWIEPIHQG